MLENLRNLIGRKVSKTMATIIENWLVAAIGSWKTTVVGGLAMVAVLAVSYTHLTLPTIFSV